MGWNPSQKKSFCYNDGLPFVNFLEAFSLQDKKSKEPSEFYFQGGWIGYVSYEALSYFHSKIKIPHHKNYPTTCFAYYESFIYVNHKKSESFFVSIKQTAEARSDFEKLMLLQKIPTQNKIAPSPLMPQSQISPERYQSDFGEIKQALHNGTYYELNYTVNHTTDFSGDALTLYLRLRETTKAPMMVFLDFTNIKILSASPELFFKIKNQIVTTKPIKGTMKRGQDAAEDAVLKNQLFECPKSQAELLMVTDMLRNDLGRFCETGSVKVAQLSQVETFSHYHHLVATITGKTLPNQTLADVFKNMFPGGSITGAPKIKVMQEISRLENRARGIYTGAIGLISNHGFVEFNIPIRTMTIVKNILEFSVGGGIVADSTCAGEFEECQVKAVGILGALGEGLYA